MYSLSKNINNKSEAEVKSARDMSEIKFLYLHLAQIRSIFRESVG